MHKSKTDYDLDMDTGKFFAPEDVSFKARSMPGKPSDYEVHVFRVKKPIKVDTSNATPWFNKGGGGKQYEVNKLKDLVEEGDLEYISKGRK